MTGRSRRDGFARKARAVGLALVGCLALALHIAGADASVTAGWSLQQPPDPAGATSSVLSGVSCAAPRTCIAVGHFTDATGTGVTLAERWNGTSWRIQRTPNPARATSSLLFGVSCASKRTCIAVGSETTRAGNTLPLAERWNGATWSIQKIADPSRASVSYLGAVSCASRRACAAVGYSGNSPGTAGVTLAERWNGSSWAVQRTPTPPRAQATFLSGVSCSEPTVCTATGFSIDGVGAGATLAERWNGTGWTLQSTPTPAGASYAQLPGVSCASASSCTAVGFFSDVTGIEVMLGEQWNAADWQLQRTPYPAGARYVQFLGVSCSSPATCTAVGFFNNRPGFDVPLAERREGARWVIQPTPYPAGGTDNQLDGVSCASNTVCVAVGGTTNSAGAAVTLAERYSR